METLTITKFMSLLGHDSLQGGILVLTVLAAQWALGKRLAPRWRSALWLLVMTRLLLVVSVGSVISVFNFLPHWDGKSTAHAEITAPAMITKPAASGQPAASSLMVAAPDPSSQVVPESSAKAYPPPTPTGLSPMETMPSQAEAKRGSPLFAWSRIWFLIWLMGAGSMAAYVLAGSVLVNRRMAQMRPISDPQLLALLADCEARLGIGRRLSVVEGAQMGTPALHGFFRPRLLLPLGFAAQFSPQELRFILLHELAHVRRRDILLNWLAAMLLMAHWFNPVIWFGFARWRADRELACDALALEAAGGNQSQAYGQTILRLLENFTQRATVPGLVGILEDKKQLRQRIRMIASFRGGSKLGILTAAMLAVLGIVCLTDAQNNSGASKTAPATPVATVTNRLDQAPAESRQIVTNGPAVKITILDAATGLPLEHAEVFAPNQAAFFGGQENAPRWTTGKDGVAVIHTGQLTETWQCPWFTLSAEREGYAPYGMSWTDAKKDVRLGLPAEITIRLKPGLAVGGTVYDENGSPQPGIKVRIYGTGYDWGIGNDYHQEYPEYWNDSAGSSLPVTDTTGRWQVKDFPPDLQNVAIEFIRPDGSVEKFRNPPRAVNPNEPQGDPMDFEAFHGGNARFVLKSGNTVHGLTVNPQGQPVPAVRIKIGYGAANLERAGEIQSDSSGHFNLRHINHRQVILTAEAPGYAITSQIVDLQSNVPEVRLQLDKLAPLRMKVVDGNGQVMARARVSTHVHGTEGQVLDFSGMTDTKGGLVWTNAPISSFAIAAMGRASSRDSSVSQKIMLTSEQREITFCLRAGMDEEVIVKGQVTDAKTGRPVKLDSITWQTGDREGFKRSGGISDSGFRLNLPATGFRSGIVSIYRLQLKAAGYGLLITPWRGFDEGDWNPDFKLQPADTAGGTVSLADLHGNLNEPAAGAQLWTRPDMAGGTLIIDQPGRYYDYGDRMIKVQADDDGKFVLPGVPDDQPVVFTHPDGFLSTSMGELKNHPNVRLESWGRVTGILKIAGKPVGGISISLAQLTWSPDLDYTLNYSTSTASDGSFAFEQVPAGEYKLYRHRSRNGPITEDHQFPFVVKPGETVNLEYSNPGRPVIGQAKPDQPETTVDWLKDDHTLTLKQKPMDSPMVNYKDFATFHAAQKAYYDSYQSPERLQQAREARTYVLAFEPDGSFRAEDVPPGTYELNIKVMKPGKNVRPSPFPPNPQDELGSLTREVVVPAGDGPFDLGTLTVAMKGSGGSAAK